MQKLKQHLKHLIYNDATSNHYHGTNHNAMDRSCIYDRFIGHLTSGRFEKLYEENERSYRMYKNGFDEPAPYDHATYYESENQIEEYASEIAENAIAMLMEKIEKDWAEVNFQSSCWEV